MRLSVAKKGDKLKIGQICKDKQTGTIVFIRRYNMKLKDELFTLNYFYHPFEGFWQGSLSTGHMQLFYLDELNGIEKARVRSIMKEREEKRGTQK